jgi:hypothetical protein
MPPTTAVVCEPCEVGELDMADEVCVIDEDTVLLELVVAVTAAVAVGAVAAVSGLEVTEASVRVFPVER